MTRTASAGALLLFSVCADSCQSSPAVAQTQQEAGNGPYVHVGSGFRFPKAVGEFTRVKITEYNAAATDVSVGYNQDLPGKQIAVTVYVYPAPNVLGPAQDEACSDQFRSMKAEIESAHAGAR